jgi:hypothetical protein
MLEEFQPNRGKKDECRHLSLDMFIYVNESLNNRIVLQDHITHS